MLWYLICSGFENIGKNKVMAFASYCVLLVSGLLICFSILFSKNLNSIIGDIETKNEIAVYINFGTNESEINTLRQGLSEISNVDSDKITFYSKTQAFEDMKDQLKNNGEEDVDLLFSTIENDNPLPDAFLVSVTDISLMNDTVIQIKALPYIQKVNAPDTFAEVLVEFENMSNWLCLAITIAMGIISLVIIYNMARVSVLSRAREINIMRYVGASNFFIRFPFFTEGLVIGVFAGISATFITWLSYDYIIELLMKEQELTFLIMNGLIPFHEIAYNVAFWFVVLGAAIGSFGTVISIRKHLNV